MGKICSRFKFLRSSTTSKQNTYAVDSSGFDDINCARYNDNNNNTDPNNMSAIKIQELNNFQEFDNLLSVTCIPNTSYCMFGQSDYVSV